MKTYTLQEVADKVRFHKAMVKVVAIKLHIDPNVPIEEEDAIAIATKLKRKWSG